jgi:hypothetical protein
MLTVWAASLPHFNKKKSRPTVYNTPWRQLPLGNYHKRTKIVFIEKRLVVPLQPANLTNQYLAWPLVNLTDCDGCLAQCIVGAPFGASRARFLLPPVSFQLWSVTTYSQSDYSAPLPVWSVVLVTMNLSYPSYKHPVYTSVSTPWVRTRRAMTSWSEFDHMFFIPTTRH